MELILKSTIDNLGEEGDVVKVKAGFGRNYLIPQRLATLATKANLAVLESEKAVIAARRAQQKEEAESLSKKLSGLTVTIEKRTGAENKLYGSVTSNDLAEKLAELGVTIDKRKIQLEEPIKTLGVTMVPVKVGYQMLAEIKVEIIAAAE